MPFKVHVSFTGICAFVPNKAFDNSPTKISVVLPKGGSKYTYPKVAVDGTRLRRHFAFAQFKLRHLTTSQGLADQFEGIWYWGRRRLTFGFTGYANDLSVGNMSTLADMYKVAPKFSTVDPLALTDSPPSDVLCEILINRGSLSTGGILKTWVFPNTLSGDTIHSQTLTSEVVLEFSGLETFELIATPYNAGAPEKVSFSAPNDVTVPIVLSNLCDDNPLRWETDVADLPPDEDFKWYYQLLSRSDRDALFTALGGLPLPFPYSKERLNGQGMNCLPVGTKPQV